MEIAPQTRPTIGRLLPVFLCAASSSVMSDWSYGGRLGAILYAARSLTSADVVDLAQWAQQKNRPPTSTPCPITLHLQCSQIGAIAWIAHSKLSKVWCAPAAISSKLLSYSLPQTSHVAICHPFVRPIATPGGFDVYWLKIVVLAAHCGSEFRSKFR